MADQQTERAVARRLTIDVYEDGGWQLNVKPGVPAMLKYDALGILMMVIAALQAPSNALVSQTADAPALAIDEGKPDVPEN